MKDEWEFARNAAAATFTLSKDDVVLARSLVLLYFRSTPSFRERNPGRWEASRMVQHAFTPPLYRMGDFAQAIGACELASQEAEYFSQSQI